MVLKTRSPSESSSSQPSSVVFGRFSRPSLPVAVLPLPTAATGPTLVETPPGVDLSGKRKALFFIGRGRIGKTTLTRLIGEFMDERGGTAIVAAADPINRSLRIFRNNVAEPDSSEPDDVRDWLRDLLQHVMEQKANAMIDLGGGSTSLSSLLREMPDLAGELSRHGVEPIAIHVVGADPHDLVPLAITEAEGFQPRATAIVLNEIHARRDRFDQVLQHPAFHAAVQRGAVPIWMPRLSPDAAKQCDAYGWRYHDVQDKAGPFTASAVQTWLRQMAQQFAPISTWDPE
jgi:hypothetical protein